MSVAKPLRVFTLGKRRILTCLVQEGNPFVFLNKEVLLVTPTVCEKKIRIEGVSTASDVEKDVYDFLYTGDEIEPRDISAESELRLLP